MATNANVAHFELPLFIIVLGEYQVKLKTSLLQIRMSHKKKVFIFIQNYTVRKERDSK